MAAMTSQSAIAFVLMAGLDASSWEKTLGNLSYVHGVKTLLITPVLLSHAPVRMAVHEGLETVVCPTLLGAELVLVSIKSKKLSFSGYASTLFMFVPSIATTNTCCLVGSAGGSG